MSEAHAELVFWSFLSSEKKVIEDFRMFFAHVSGAGVQWAKFCTFSVALRHLIRRDVGIFVFVTVRAPGFKGVELGDTQTARFLNSLGLGLFPRIKY